MGETTINAFYQSFGAAPEAAGVSYAQIVVENLTIIVAYLLILSCIGIAINGFLIMFAPRAKLLGRNPGAVILAELVVSALVVSLYFVPFPGHPPGSASSIWPVLAIVMPAAVVFSWIVPLTGEWIDSGLGKARLMKLLRQQRVTIWLLLASPILLGVTIIFLHSQAASWAAEVKAGVPVLPESRFISFTEISAEPVAVLTLSGQPLPETASQRCVMQLGHDENLLLLYEVDSHTLIRIPAAAVILRSSRKADRACRDSRAGPPY